MIDYVLHVTQNDQLYYVGHSQGTLVGFLSFSAHREIAKKVKLFIALAPIFHLDHTVKFVRDIAYLLGPIQVITCRRNSSVMHEKLPLSFLTDRGLTNTN